ncbi:MAG: single-stranded DNA-binding protein, partial [Clostridia bacterium]|nr:single-stranded DNA-binding protein [Clostridia bacterium]
MNNLKENNKVYLSGEIVTDAVFSHEVYGESFYEMCVSVNRLSGQADILPITVSERLINKNELKIGSKICALGQFRSYNKLVDNKSKLMLTVFIREILEDNDNFKNPNSIMLCGFVCKPPVYRTTPFNREIADLLIAVNRSYNKSD